VKSDRLPIFDDLAHFKSEGPSLISLWRSWGGSLLQDESSPLKRAITHKRKLLNKTEGNILPALNAPRLSIPIPFFEKIQKGNTMNSSEKDSILLSGKGVSNKRHYSYGSSMIMGMILGLLYNLIDAYFIGGLATPT